MSVTVSEFSGAAAEWDAAGQRDAGWTHCHRFAWKEVLERAFGHRCLYLAARGPDGALEGILPLVGVRSLLFGHHLVSMPYLSYGGPLGSDAAVRALAEAAVERGRRLGVKRVELRSLRPLPLPAEPACHKITAILDLPETVEGLWEGFGSKLRSQVRRPVKEGVTVEHGPERMEDFVEVFSRHMTHLGTPTHSPRLFRALREVLGEDAWFASAYHEGRPIAAGCCVRSGKEVEIVWASALAEHRRLSANMLLYASLMERATAAGVRRFNFGRCTPDTGSHRFKAQWGPRELPLYWYRHPGTPRPAAEAAAEGWGPRLWRRLPVPVARAVGPWIRKGITL